MTPKEIMDVVPISEWLRNPLRERTESLLNKSLLKNGGYFNPSPIRKKWEEHLSDTFNWASYLWDILMFQSWLQKWKNNS